MRLLTRLAILTAAAAIIPACGGSSGDGTSPSSGGGLKILIRGGTGTAGNGGQGGDFEIYSFAQGDLMILRSGSVNTSVTVPSVTPDLGTRPLIVTASTILPYTAFVEDPPASGRYKLDAGGGLFYTGLWVKPGATLTIQPNVDIGGLAGNERASFELTDGLYVEGTILMARKDNAGAGTGGTLDGADLQITSGSAVIAAAGKIDSSGSDTVGAAGGSGGRVTLLPTGSIVNAGSVDTTGGNGDSGGTGGIIDFRAGCSFYNTGNLVSDGGSGAAGLGGAAGRHYLYGSNTASTYGGAFHLGAVSSRGGDGTAGGGAGGRLDLYTLYVGAVVNGGTIDSSGGNATVAGAGGSAGNIGIFARNGSARVSGTLTARGGTGIGGNGGTGGIVEIENTNSASAIAGRPIVGGVYIGAGVDASGGSGASGGRGGCFYAWADSGGFGTSPGLDDVMLVGYDTVDLSGGDGSVNGGSADDVTFSHYGALDDNGNRVLGNVVSETDWIGRGGDGASGWGGGGSRANFDTNQDNVPLFDRSLTNRGSIDVSGGNGGTSGGQGGSIYLYDYFKVVNTGTLTARGGTGGTGAGGGSLGVTIESDDVVTNSASITTDGGASGSNSGGTGGTIELVARSTTTAGNLSARGGASATGTGGNGATIRMFSTENGTVKSGTFTVAGGLGTPVGTDGNVFIDGIDAALTGGSIGF